MKEIFNKLGITFNTSAVTVLTIFGNLFICFFGYRFHKFVLAFIGFILGFNFTKTLTMNMHLETNIIYLLAIVIGIFCGYLSKRIYNLGIVIVVFGLTYNGLLSVLTNYLGSYNGTIVTIVAAIFLSLTALRFIKPVIVLVTSFAGGFGFAHNLVAILKLDISYALIIGLIVFLFGLMYQFKEVE